MTTDERKRDEGTMEAGGSGRKKEDRRKTRVTGYFNFSQVSFEISASFSINFNKSLPMSFLWGLGILIRNLPLTINWCLPP